MVISSGGNGTIGQLIVGSLITSSSTTLNFDLTTPGGSGDLINVTGGSLTFAAGTMVNVTIAGSPLSGAIGSFSMPMEPPRLPGRTILHLRASYRGSSP